MTKRLLILLFLHLSLQGQVFEDFDEGAIANSSTWKGDRHVFRINADKQLQLNDSVAGTSYLSTPCKVNNQASWQFDIQLAFNPSNQNYARIYLISDTENLTQELNGYYLRIGGSDDEISLFRQDLNKHTKLIDGEDGITDIPTLDMSIKVTRDHHGQWQLIVNLRNDSEPLLVGQAVDDTHTRSAFFGFYCTYTKTRSDGFYFDNIIVEGQQFIDMDPPLIESLEAVNMTVKVKFSEPIVIPATNQIRINGVGNPISLIQTAYATLELVFAQSFSDGNSYTLEAVNVSDFFENTTSLSIQFQYWELGKVDEYGILITEIMADPSPPMQLPEVEYVELFNSSDRPVDLNNWVLSDENRSIAIPGYLLPPGQYLIVHQPGIWECPDGILCLEMASWPTLNNSADIITLVDPSGVLIHSISYDKTWYRSEVKQHGGWSLEMIDSSYPCSGQENWTASIAPSGGTPGAKNSVATDNPDHTPPRIVSTFAESPVLVSITFDQALSSNTLDPDVTLKPHKGVDTSFIEYPHKTKLVSLLTDSLEEKQIYQITINNIADCNGNLINSSGITADLGLPQSADSGDLVINEVLFNPKPLGSRFIELFNRSTKALNLKDWRVGRIESNLLVDLTQISSVNRMIYPGDYLAITEDPGNIRMHYPYSNLAPIIEVKELPTLGDRQGSIVLLSSESIIVDRMSYSSEMHHQLLTDLNGVSLERGDPDESGANLENWFSGAELNGYATPGLPNSQQYSVLRGSLLSVEPEIISPLSIQLPSYALISFTLEQPGASGSIQIFNSQGFLIKTLVSNALLPTNGSYQWDGTNDKGQAVSMGYYIILFQLTNPLGATQQITETLVVAPK